MLELTYNYDVKGYRLGNDHVFFKIRNRVAYNNLEEQVGQGGAPPVCCSGLRGCAAAAFELGEKPPQVPLWSQVQNRQNRR